MKTRRILLVGLIGLALAVATALALGDTVTAAQQKGYYLECMKKECDICGSKAKLVKSRSANLRAYALQAAQRSAFILDNREALAQEMALKNVRMRPYAVHHYLLHRFNEQSGQLAAATGAPGAVP